MKKSEIVSEFQSVNKEVYHATQNVREQNKKINEIDEKVDCVDGKIKATNKYVKGFQGFFGFFTSLFSSTKKTTSLNKEEIESSSSYSTQDTYTKPTPQQSEIGMKKPPTLEDELEDEINNLNRDAKRLNGEIDISLHATKQLEDKITKTDAKMKKINDNANEVKRKYYQ